MPLIQSAQSFFKRFRREDGAVSVEMVIWLPFFAITLTVLADAALIFYGQARALQVAQDANRGLSIGRFTSYEETSEYIKSSISKMSPNASAQTTSNDGLITSVVTLPASDLAAVGFIAALTSFEMQVVAQMVQEF